MLAIVSDLIEECLNGEGSSCQQIYQLYQREGCMNPDALNYDEYATHDDGSCEFEDASDISHSKLIDLYLRSNSYLSNRKGDMHYYDTYLSHESTSGVTRNKGEWTKIPSWHVSGKSLKNYQTSSTSFKNSDFSKITINLWWMEDMNDTDFDASLDYRFTVMKNGLPIYQFTDESGQECDQDQGASPESPCFYTVDLVLPLTEYNSIYGVSFSENDNLSIDIEIKSFQTIQILYGNEELDTGITLFASSGEADDDNDNSPEEAIMFYLPLTMGYLV